MKIRMRVTAAGPKGNWIEGRTYDVPRDIPEADAQAFVKGGYAAVIEDAKPAPAPAKAAEKKEKEYTPGPAETAAAEAPEQAAASGKPAGKKR